jgi:hypothetical protein
VIASGGVVDVDVADAVVSSLFNTICSFDSSLNNLS